MSELWPVKKLGDFSNIRYGYTEKASSEPIGPRFLRITDIKNGGVNWDEVPYCRITDEDFSKYQLEKGDIVFARTGATTGKSFLITESPDSVFASYLIRVQITDSAILPEFVYLYFQSASYWDMVNAGISGSAQGGFNASKLSELTIPIPPIEEQQRIVSILDEALKNSKSMLDECRKKLLNSVELFRSLLRSIFDQSQGNVSWNSNGIQFPKLEVFQPLNEQLPSSTRGRKETERTIEGNLSLSVGLPSIIPRKGWSWSKLTNLARLESGHTPSRRFPEYWGVGVPWIGIKDARNNYGKIIINTLEQTNELGLANSAARLLPKGTVCLSRTASVGYVVVMGTEMATSQDFVNWVCTPELDPHFLKFLLMAERDGFTNYSSGSVHQTIYFPEVKAFHICHPDVDTQRRIAEYLNGACLQFESLQELYKKEIEVMEQLGLSILEDAFNGKLTGGIAT